MTRITGYFIKANPCCGTVYITPRYGSINLSAWAYWTDGYKEGALMPDGHGLRQCKCGNFYLLRELLTISEGDTAEAPRPDYVKPEDLPNAIASARNPEIELAARLDYWQHLNHTYRDRYRTHREAEELATQTVWETANPDQRTWWQRIRKVARYPAYRPAPDRPFTYPAFVPTDAQCENMCQLLVLLQTGSNRHRYGLEIAELHRELSQFEEASQAMRYVSDDEGTVTIKLMGDLINDKQSAPVRYRV